MAGLVVLAMNTAGRVMLSPAADVNLGGQAAVTLPMPIHAVAGANCSLTVPSDPLSAQGLASLYRLSGPGCSMANTVTRAFVQATIFDPATSKLSVYEPLVVTKGTRPAAAPVLPSLPQDAIVTIDFGFNGDNLTLVPAHGGIALQQGKCVNGLHGSIFGQVAYCNGRAFFAAVRKAERAGSLTIPGVGTGNDGQPCPTVRSFTMIDQDQSDNVTTRYLVTPAGQTAQDNAANLARLPHATLVGNGSDNALLDTFIDPALGCTPFMAPDLSMAMASGTSQALDEIMAAADQQAPMALVPVNDPMAAVNGKFSVAKTNLYRDGFDQRHLATGVSLAHEAQLYCANMLKLQVPWLQLNQGTLSAMPPADPAVGSNLFTFLAARLSGSFGNLGCAQFNQTNPVQLTLNNRGVAVKATFGAPMPTASSVPGGPGTPTPTPPMPTPSATSAPQG